GLTCRHGNCSCADGLRASPSPLGTTCVRLVACGTLLAACNVSAPCCAGLTCTDGAVAIAPGHCAATGYGLGIHDFEPVLKRESGGISPTRVYLTHFSAASFLVVKLVLKIFVIITCCALLQ
ncbi:unnamed protein product, partial [Notodromas monacha]